MGRGPRRLVWGYVAALIGCAMWTLTAWAADPTAVVTAPAYTVPDFGNLTLPGSLVICTWLLTKKEGALLAVHVHVNKAE